MGFSYRFGFGFGSSPEGIGADQATDLLVSLLPRGAATWYGLKARVGDVYNTIALMGDLAKMYGHDMIKTLRSENNPLTLALNLDRWEGALGLSGTPTARNGTTPARRTAVVSKLRESGSFTIANIQAIIGPLLGYADTSQLQILEASRSALTTAHTYANNTGAAIGGSSSVTQKVAVLDDGAVSASGVQVAVTITSTNPEQLSFALTGPTGTAGQATKTWAAGSLPAGSVTSQTFYLYDKASTAGKAIFANGVSQWWTLQINTGAAACTLVSWSLFVEGIGRDANGYDGLGAAMYDWAVYADPAKISSPDYTAVKNSITRIRPGFSSGELAVNASAKPGASFYPPFISRAT